MALPKTTNQPVRAAVAAFIGTTIEWYDFFIYGTAAALVFGELFFPNSNAFVGLLASFATFAVGFFARPFGGFVFGHLGDRIGRKRALIATLLIMGAATTGVGFLPTFATAGIWAPVMLVGLRLLQGISVGGEWGGAVLMAGEHAPWGRRTWFASFAQLGSPVGLLLSLAAFRGATAVSGAEFLAWGWRLPFLGSAVLLLVGLAIRLGVQESPEFAALRERREVAPFPLAVAVRTAAKPILMTLCAFTIGTAGFYFTSTFLLAYTTHTLSMDRSIVLDCLTAVSVVQFFGQLGAARLAERIGDARFLKWAAGLAMIAPYPMFLLVETRMPAAIVLGASLATLCASGFYAVIAGFSSKVFHANVRYTAISVAYQMGGAIFGGFTPMIGVVLSQRFAGQWLPLAAFYTVLAGISFAGVFLLDRSMRGRPAIQAADQRPVSMALDA
jgi:MFS family permease